MNQDFLRAVVDTLLPGDAILPAGSVAGVDLGKYAETLGPALQLIANAAGGEEALIETDEARRVAILKAVQHDAPESFTRLLGALLPDYYEASAVLKALGWRSEPPQPRGHVVPATDDVTCARLERVKSRGKLWRDGA
jgi:hypothetical protein